MSVASNELTKLFEGASKVTQQNVLLLLNRDHKGQKEYGCSLDRCDLRTDEWFQHAIEEVADLLGYLRAAKNSESATQRTPNAKEISIPKIIHDLFMAIAKVDDPKNTALRALVGSLYSREPRFWKLVRVLLELEESKEYQKSPEKIPADFMLNMVSGLNREQQRDLLKEGLEHVTATKITFVDVTPKTTQ